MDQLRSGTPVGLKKTRKLTVTDVGGNVTKETVTSAAPLTVESVDPVTGMVRCKMADGRFVEVPPEQLLNKTPLPPPMVG